MAIRITDTTMTLEIDNHVVAMVVLAPYAVISRDAATAPLRWLRHLLGA